MNAIAGLETSCDRRIEEPEGHGHRRPAKGGDRLVAERHSPGRDLFDPADGFIERWPVDGFGGCRWCATTDRPDRTSVVSGKSVSGRVYLGGRRILQQKKKSKNK